MMSGLTRMTLNEMRLFLREPVAVFFGVFFPSLLVVILGSIPAFRVPIRDLGGLRVVDLYVPISIALSLALLALTALPSYLGTYREKGILRRLAVTPMPPARLLLAQLLTNLVMAIVSVALLLTVARILFDVALPRQIIGYSVAFLLAAAALFAMGLFVAAIAPSGRSAPSIGMLLYFPIMFFAGLYVPRAAMPPSLQRIGDYTPLGAGVQALQDSMTGLWPQPLHLAVMAAYVIVFGVAAARLFRWE
jgi:ABC-2 type transport system permease protein